MSEAVSDPDDGELSVLNGRKAMNAQMLPTVRKEKAKVQVQVEVQMGADHTGWANQYAKVVHKAMDDHDVYVKQEELDELEARKMVHTDSMVTLKLVLHQEANGSHVTLVGGSSTIGSGELVFLTDVAENIRFEELGHVIRKRLGTERPVELLWLHRSGETIALDLSVWRHYTLANWCTQPWTIHVRLLDERGLEHGKPLRPILLRSMAKVLFDRYDVNVSGHVEKRELLRLFHDLSLEQLNCSDKFLEGFIDGEFARLDVVRLWLPLERPSDSFRVLPMPASESFARRTARRA